MTTTPTAAFAFQLYVTNFVVHESTPYVFGVTKEGQTVGVRVVHMPYIIYIEPTYDADDEHKTRTWFNKRVRPFLETTGRCSRHFRPACVLQQRQKLCGYSEKTHWFIKVMYDNAMDARKDAYDVLRKFKICHVYHDRLDPHLIFTAHTGLRCFMWLTCQSPSVVTAHRAKKTRCDIEMQCDVGRLLPTFKDDSDPRNVPPLLKVAAFDIETDGLSWEEGHEIRMISISCGQSNILLTRHPLENEHEASYMVVNCSDETDLLTKFVDLVGELRPIFLTGWNIFRFDMQFVFERAKMLGIFQHMERLSWLACKQVRPVVKEMNSSAFGQNKIYHDDLQGLIVLDGYMLARKGMKMPSYSLKAFGEWIGEPKGDVTYDEMVQAFTTKCPKKMRNVADYCVQDSKMVPKILERMEEPCRVMALTRLAAVPPVYTIKRGQSILTFGLILAEAFQRKLVVNPPPKKAGDNEGYQGATVIDPVRGYHKDPVCVLDFESLYPSIMRAYNICISTFLGTWQNRDDVPNEYTFPEYSVIEIDAGVCVVFKRKGIEGVFPSILRVLLEQRKTVKTTMKSFEKGSIQYNQANAKQLSLKVAANSLYGYLGAPTSQIYEKALAASVTSMGRQSLFQVRTIIETLCKEGRLPSQVHVVYGDSVTGNTPILLRKKGRVSIKCMDELSPSNGRWFQYHGTKESFVPSVHLEVWQDGGFTKVTRVIRHKTRKAILRVMTSTGVVDCTEDHSLLTKEGLKVSPNATNIGDQLLHYDDQDLHAEWQHVMLKSKSKYTKEQAFERGVYENDIDHDLLCGPLENVEAFWEGMDVREDRFYTKKVAMGLCLLGKRLGLSFRFASYDETSDKFALLPYENDDQNTGEVEHLWIVSENYEAYVYDLQTQNHHFSVGPGNLVVHNTDSVMIKFPEISTETANELATFIEKECTQAFVPPMRLEFENLFSTYLLENKKRYAGRVWPTNETVVKGMCTKRRDFPKIVQDALQGILDLLLQGGEDAPTKALEFVETILHQLSTNAVPIESLCITKELNRSKYKTPPPHLIVSQKMASRNPHDPPKAGDRITFVVMHGKGNVSERAEDYAYAKNLSNTKFDLAYYAEQLVSQSENMMTICGKKTEFERLAHRYINIARLYCNNQKKLSVFFQPTTTPSSIPPATTITSKKRELPSPKKQQQSTLKKFFVQKVIN